MRPFVPLALLLVLSACSQEPQVAQDARPPAAKPAPEDTPAGASEAPSRLDPNQPAGVYQLDPMHSTVTFKVTHIGMSSYTAQFDKIAGQLTLDPKQPEAASVSVTIDPHSLHLPAPPPGFKDKLMGPDWLDAKACPQIAFKSTSVKRTGQDSADVTGDLTIHCITKPVTLKAKFNGGYPPGGLDPSGARIGFSAATDFKRSDFGVSQGIPAPGSEMGVGDKIDVAIEAEFTSPGGPAAKAQPAPKADPKAKGG